MLNQGVKRKFEAEKLEGTTRQRVVTKPHNKPFEYTVEERDKGWMVYLTNGNSLHITKESEMVRLGFLRPAPLVDTNTGEIVPQYEPPSLKDEARRRTAPSTAKVMKRKAAERANAQEAANV